MQASGIHEQIDLDDFAVGDGEAGHPEQPATTNPAPPLTSAGPAKGARREKATPRLATANAPRTSLEASGGLAPRSIRSTTSGSSTESSASKSAPRAAARKASTNSRWRSRSTSGTGAP